MSIKIKWQAAPISPSVLTHSHSEAYNCATCIFLHGFDPCLQVHLIPGAMDHSYGAQWCDVQWFRCKENLNVFWLGCWVMTSTLRSVIRCKKIWMCCDAGCWLVCYVLWLQLSKFKCDVGLWSICYVQWLCVTKSWMCWLWCLVMIILLCLVMWSKQNWTCWLWCSAMIDEYVQWLGPTRVNVLVVMLGYDYHVVFSD